MGSAVLYGGPVLALLLLIAIHHRLAILPTALSIVARRERIDGEARAMTALQEAAAAKVGPITTSLRALAEQSEARNRDAVAAAELRARVAERRASEAASALGAASELVRELRMTLDGLGDLRATLARMGEPPTVASPRVTPVPDSGARKTVEVEPQAGGTPPPTRAGEGDPDDERTKVSSRSVVGAPPESRPAILPPPSSGAGHG